MELRTGRSAPLFGLLERIGDSRFHVVLEESPTSAKIIRNFEMAVAIPLRSLGTEKKSAFRNERSLIHCKYPYTGNLPECTFSSIAGGCIDWHASC